MYEAVRPRVFINVLFSYKSRPFTGKGQFTTETVDVIPKPSKSHETSRKRLLVIVTFIGLLINIILFSPTPGVLVPIIFALFQIRLFPLKGTEK